MTSTAPKMDNTPIVSPQKIATRIGFKIGSIVEVSDAVTGETRSNPLDKNTYDNPNCTIPNTRTYPPVSYTHLIVTVLPFSSVPVRDAVFPVSSPSVVFGQSVSLIAVIIPCTN